MRRGSWRGLAAMGALAMTAGSCAVSFRDYSESQGSGGGGGGGGAGGGGGGECELAQDCPATTEACKTPVCTAGKCGLAPLQDGASCSSGGGKMCSAGKCVACVHDDECPPSADECGQTQCSPDHECVKSKPDGSPCGAGGQLKCEGGACTGCAESADCGIDTPCTTVECVGDSGDGKCVHTNTPDDTPTTDQTAGDCKKNVCLGGIETAVADATDPENDSNDCTSDTCDGKNPVHANLGAGFPCNTPGGEVCDGSGHCVECNVPADCPDPPSCKVNVCQGNACGTANAIDFTDCPTGTCLSGVCVECFSPNDCGTPPVCKTNTCNSNVCGTANATNGSACSPPSGGHCTSGACGP